MLTDTAQAIASFPEAPREPSILSREQIVERILGFSPGLSTARLAGFDAPALRLYLNHLAAALGPRGSAGWMRPGDTPAILTREPRDD